jgi:hypothetical protein
LDSLIASMALVMLGMPPARAGKLCAAFMIFDGFATLTGLSVHTPFAPALLGAYLVLLLAVATRSPLRTVFWAPALFSLDNLLAGIAAKPSPASGIWLDSLTAAFTSGLLALIGIAIAAAIASKMPRRWVYCAGLILLLAAICI